MENTTLDPLKDAFAHHPRQWRRFHYVYPVISRRARGLSLGVNLNPDGACNFDCVYCSVDRGTPPAVRRVDPAVLRTELRQLAGHLHELFDEPEFSRVPPEFRRWNDVAFSGDGEPTAAPVFPEAARIVAEVRAELGARDVKIVLITDACYLTRLPVADTLAFLDGHGLEVWAKLDAGTEEHFRRVNRPNYPLAHVLDNILATARVRPVVIQSLFLRLDGQPPAAGEIEAYVDRLRALRDDGARLALVQVYTVARRTAEASATALTRPELEAIAAAIEPLGLPVAVFD